MFKISAAVQQVQKMFRFIYLLALLILGAAPPSYAQTYPASTVKLIVPFAPGGGADALARPFAERLRSEIGQTVVVENRPGAFTVIAGNQVARAKPDGSTLYLMPGGHVLTPFLVKQVPFDPISDFTMVTLIATQAYVLASNPKQPFTTLGEMIQYSKVHPDVVSVGVTDTVTRAGMETLRTATNAGYKVVNYKGGGDLTNALIGGHVSAGIIAIVSYAPFVQDKRIVGLAVTSPTRLGFLPELATVAEAAQVPGYELQTWYVLGAPAKLAAEVVAQLDKATAKIVAAPEIRETLTRLGMQPSEVRGPEEALRYVKHYMDRMGEEFRAAGISSE